MSNFTQVTLTLLLSTLFLGCLSAQTADTNDKLPESVKAADGQVSLFVDWEQDEDSSVTAYIINKSDSPIRLGSRNGSCYLRLEAKNDANEWERTEMVVNEWCGTGLDAVTLKPGMFLKQQHSVGGGGADPLGGPAELAALIKEKKDFMMRARMTKEAHSKMLAEIDGLENRLAAAELAAAAGDRPAVTVRLRVYDANFHGFSNEGTANANTDQIEACKNDVGAIRFAEIGKLRGIINGDIEVEIDDQNPMASDPKFDAVYALARPWHPIEEVTVVLNEVLAGDNKELAAAAIEAQKTIKSRSK